MDRLAQSNFGLARCGYENLARDTVRIDTDVYRSGLSVRPAVSRPTFWQPPREVHAVADAPSVFRQQDAELVEQEFRITWKWLARQDG
jgi:hypothetical protein